MKMAIVHQFAEGARYTYATSATAGSPTISNPNADFHLPVGVNSGATYHRSVWFFAGLASADGIKAVRFKVRRLNYAGYTGTAYVRIRKARYNVKYGDTGFTSIPMELHTVVTSGAGCYYKTGLSGDVTAVDVNNWQIFEFSQSEIEQFAQTGGNQHFAVQLAERANGNSGLSAWRWGTAATLDAFQAHLEVEADDALISYDAPEGRRRVEIRFDAPEGRRKVEVYYAAPEGFRKIGGY